MKDIMANLTSPAKLAFAAYVLLLYHGDITPPPYVTAVVFVLFIAVQIAHDDWFRILLNHWALQAAAKQRRVNRFTKEYEDISTSADLARASRP